ncbi:MAG: rod shape-determining protein MreC [Armatimonadetes bacterium RBG_16_58_9]|nr:MAG: rod shape-determining protein MreC [Armatimonadetes bacterium RBG_16_58_9]
MLASPHNHAVLTLVALLVLGIAIGTAHNRALQHGETLLLQDVTRSVLAPSEIAFSTIAVAGKSAARIAKPRRALLRENASLRIQLQRLTRENARLREMAGENARLREALDFRESTALKMIAAEVISRRESNWFDTATIDRGTKAGVERGNAIVTRSGKLIGQVAETGPFTAQMVSLTDSNSAVGAMVQRSRCTGILQGQSTDSLVLSLFSKDADVRKSDIVISSGVGQVIPKGFEIGRVASVRRKTVDGTTSVRVIPSVAFDQAEQVFVVKLVKP